MEFVGGQTQAAIVDRVRGQDLSRCLVVPVDVGKHAAAALVADWYGQVVAGPMRFGLDEPGVASLLATIDGAGRERQAGWLEHLTDVIGRDRERLRELALQVWSTGEWDGLRWWSWWRPVWRNQVLWSTDTTSWPLEVTDVSPLALEHPAVETAASMLPRPRS